MMSLISSNIRRSWLPPTGFQAKGKPHPRYFGTFPRILGKYVREERAMNLPEAIRKITSMPAQRLGLQDRGMLKEGMWGDVTIFDAQRVEDKSSYMDPHHPPSGIEYVLVNGQSGCSRRSFYRNPCRKGSAEAGRQRIFPLRVDERGLNSNLNFRQFVRSPFKINIAKP